MRYIGNKTKLLPFIGDFLRKRRIRAGRALDAFAGTAAVGGFLKARGFEVVTCDIMTYSYVFQRAYVVADGPPALAGLRDDPCFAAVRASAGFRAEVESRFGDSRQRRCGPEGHRAPALAEALVYLDSAIAGRSEFITTHFSAPEAAGAPAAGGGRMYFTRENALRIDAIRCQLHEWRAAALIDDEAFYILLAALLEASDSVANTTGVYAAFVKSWQGNARRPVRLRAPAIVPASRGRCEAHQRDVNELVGEVGPLDLLYLDPPYNVRQYRGYYHVPEIIARGWFDGTLEPRGKTGLIADGEKRSAWSSRGGCVDALERVLAAADATHVALSYSNEGIIPEDDIRRLFRAYGIARTYRREGVGYARYRADADGDQRRYTANSVTEYLYYVRLK